jgi:hypothetical protein
MADTTETTDKQPADTQTQTQQPAAQAATSQEELNRIAGNARKEGRQTAMSEVLKALGVEKVEDAQAIVAAHKQAQESQQTEAQKLQAKADAAEKKAQEAEGLARRALVDTAIKLGAMRLTVKQGEAEQVLRARNPELLLQVIGRADLQVDLASGQVTGVSEALTKLATSDPYLFEVEGGQAQTQTQTPAGGTVPETPAPGSGQGLSDQQRQQVQDRTARSYRNAF